MSDKQRIITIAQRELSGMLKAERGLAGIAYIDDTPRRDPDATDESAKTTDEAIAIYSISYSRYKHEQGVLGMVYK